MNIRLKGLLLLAAWVCGGWGFFSHQMINRLAVFPLPPEMIGFYKKNIRYITEAATHPDRRRYAVADEAPRHYLDVEKYGDSAWTTLPKYWKEAEAKFGMDTLNAHGILPWHIFRMFNQLKISFMTGDPERILRNSAELGHYIGDAHVPLHTTHNYNGQLTGQTGIHAFWESRLPELYFDTYDFYVGKAIYLEDPQEAAWEIVRNSHEKVDSVLTEEKILSASGIPQYNYETKGKQTIRVYAESYSRQYHIRLHGMVERQFRASIKMTASFWFTAWVDAGQPDLKKLLEYVPTEEELKKKEEEVRQWKQKFFNVRIHETEPGSGLQ